jgi:Zn-dependent protease/CBS domain-containing protein
MEGCSSGSPFGHEKDNGMPRGWRVGRIGGVEIRVDPSLLILAALIVMWLRSLFQDPSQFRPTSGAAATGLAVLAVALFFGCILAHELAHAGVSRLRRIPVEGITLFMFGGATQARIESRGPGDEFLVTAAGPATSLALGWLFLLIWSALRPAPGDPLVWIIEQLGRANLGLGIFNLAPGFPLDGGRLLRSILWRVTGSLARATRIAGRVGQVIAALIVALGVIMLVSTRDLFGIWIALIGSMLFRSATYALAESDRRTLLESATAGEVMAPPPPTVPAEIPIEEALHRFLVGHEGEAFPVVDGSRVVGFVSLGTIKGAPLDSPVREAMIGTRGTVVAGPGERLDQVTDRLGESESRTVLVMDDGTLVGVIEPEDVTRFLQRGGSARPAAVQPPPRPDAP